MATNWPVPHNNGLERVIDERYRLRQLLGSGSLGEVFLAEGLRTTPPRLVAIKLLHTELLSEPESCQEFRHEALLLGRLTHPNVQHLIDFKLNPDLGYLVTEYAGNGSLESLLCPDPDQPPAPLSLPKIDSLLEQICAALGYLHHERLVHRDLKPANILLDQEGRPILADFSLTTFLNSQLPASLIKTAAWGTPLYAAPEVWDDQAGVASDIYALGVILFQLITGRTPYQGTLEELREQHLTAPVPGLGEIAPGLVYPPDLDKVIAGAMAKDPSQRIATAPELYRRFKAALDSAANIPGQNLSGPSLSGAVTNYNRQYFNWPVSTSSPGRRTAKKPVSLFQHLQNNLGYLLVPVLIIATIGILSLFSNQGGTKPVANSSGVPTAQARAALPTVTPSVIKYTPDVTNTIVINQAHQGRVTGLSWLPVGSVGFYSGSTDRTVRIWSFLNGQVKPLDTGIKEQQQVSTLALSPDGSILATALDDNTVVLTSRKLSYPVTLKGFSRPVNAVAWSPDGKQLATASADMTAQIWNALGTLQTNLTGHTGSVNAVAWSPDGKLLATASSDATIKVWSTAGPLMLTIKSLEGPVSAVAWSPDGKTLASASQNGTVELWKNDGTSKNVLKGHSGSVTGLDWSHNGKLLASASEDKTIRLWNSEGQLLTTLNGHNAGVSCLAWSFDDNFLVSGDNEGTIRVWKSKPDWF